MSSSYSREAKARVELDKAYQRLLENSELTAQLLELLAKEINIANGMYAMTYEGNAKELAQKYLKAKADGKFDNIKDFFDDRKNADKLNKKLGLASIGISAVSDLLSGKQVDTTIVGAVANGVLFILPKVLKGSNPILIALDIADIIGKNVFDTNMFDISGHIKNLYERLRGTTSDLPDLEMLKKGILKITMHDGTVYERPLVDIAGSYMLTGNSKDDVLFGSNGNDILNGHAGSDILIGGAGKDDYFVDNGDTIKDSDGKGRVFLSSTNIQLTGGTQIEKGSKIYKGKDGTTYELKGSDLIINDSITIENFSNDNLEIHLSEFDEISVSIYDATAVEKAGKMTFNIELTKEPKIGEFVVVNDKTYKFVNFLETNYTFEDDIELKFGSSAKYKFANLNLLVA